MSEKRRQGVSEHAEKRDQRESHEDKRPDAQADPDRSPDAEEGAGGEGQRGDNQFEEHNGERELFEIVPSRAWRGAPILGVRRCLLQDRKAGRLSNSTTE